MARQPCGGNFANRRFCTADGLIRGSSAGERIGVPVEEPIAARGFIC
jgi:hypothetical protein